MVSWADLERGYRWLGHEGWSEVGGFHPDYRMGDVEWNRRKGVFPKVGYVKDLKGLRGFVQAYADRFLVVGVNPRVRVFRNDGGFVRSAREYEIEVSQSFFLDLDFVEAGGDVDGLESLLDRVDDEFFLGRGFRVPVRSYTGGGVHLWLATPRVVVGEVPDIGRRHGRFRDEFAGGYRGELGELGVRVDSTQDLRRMVRVPGTAKPSGGVVSGFPDVERVEDECLLEYLLWMPVAEVTGGLSLSIGGELPEWFVELMRSDGQVRRLWGGRGKPVGSDVSRSGFDYSLAKVLLWRGYRDVDDLATILALRPNGGALEKGEGYIRRTIGSALIR